VPPGWDWEDPLPTTPGYDWSYVPVAHPQSPPAPPEVHLVRVVGSGTPKAVVGDPEGRFVYVVASDQGHEEVAENAVFLDGGYHVPHLYRIDLSAGDFTSQAWVNSYSASVDKWRFNKVIHSQFDGTSGPWDGQPTGPTRVSSDDDPAVLPIIGSYYPGEHQLDPTARTRTIPVFNDALVSDWSRLYIGTTGKPQIYGQGDFLGPQVGAVFCLSIGDTHASNPATYGDPRWLSTLSLTQNPSSGQAYQVAGYDVVPAGRTHLGTNQARNVLIVAGLHTRALESGKADRIYVVQDE
jgi:hypothetical protein